MKLLRGLAPVAGAEPKILILGSMPGARSLQLQQYYAHPRNRFWPLVADLFGVDLACGYPVRIEHLRAQGVALWDVLASCDRPGSLDSAIVRASEIPNPLANWIRAAPSLARIGLNGNKAADAFDRHVRPLLGPGLTTKLTILPLPSTSPANAAWSLARLRERWSTLRN